MTHRSPSKLSTTRLSTALLAGTALCAASGASAEPIQGYWLAPTILASNLGVELAAAAQQLDAQKTKVAATQADVQLLAGPEPDWKGLAPSLNGYDAPLNFSADDALQSTFAFKFRSASLDVEPSVNAKVSRLADGFAFADVDTDVIGFDAQLMNGRFTFSTDIAKTDDDLDTRDYRDPQLRDRDRTIRLTDTSRRHRFQANLIDTGSLRLLVNGDFGETSEGFASSLNELPNGRLMLPTSWSMMSSSIEYGEARVKVDYQDYATNREQLKRQGVTLGYAKSALSIYRKEGMEFNLTSGGQWLRRTSFSGINADVIVADVLPDAVADAIDPIRPFLPTVVSGGFERGDIIRAELIPGPRDRVQTANAAMTWNTKLGETTASIWERRIQTDIVQFGGEDNKIPLSRSRDRFADISHSVRHGDWRFGAGLSMIETDDTVAGVDRAGREIAPHVSVAYEPENGPRIELRYGAADAQSQIIDDNLAARAKSKQIQLSVDLSRFAQEEINKPDAKLKLEYRYDLNGSDRDPVSGRERGGGHAVLLTFSTPLN